MAFDKARGFTAEESGLDIYAELASAYVAPGPTQGPLTVLDPQRAAVLGAWAAVLIPGTDTWPSGADVDSVEYIDQTLAKATRLRPLVLGLLDHSDRTAVAMHAKDILDLSAPERTQVLTACERDQPMAFTLVMELVYEAYYRHPTVLKATTAQTGFRPTLAVDGFAVPDYDQVVMELLAEVSQRPSLVREVHS